jgi:hypothetical protein
MKCSTLLHFNVFSTYQIIILTLINIVFEYLLLFSAKVEKKEQQLILAKRRRHSTGRFTSQSFSNHGIPGPSSVNNPSGVMITSSGTDSTTNSNMNIYSGTGDSDTIWTEAEGNLSTNSSSVQPQSFPNKSKLNFHANENNGEFPKKKLSYIFEQSSDERLFDIKNTKSQLLPIPRNISGKSLNSGQEKKNGSVRRYQTINRDESQSNSSSDAQIRSNNYTNLNKESSNPYNTSIYTQNYNFKGIVNGDPRNLKGSGSELSYPSLLLTSAKSSVMETLDSRFQTF